MKSDYHNAAFILAAPALANAPPDTGREVAFLGRSNVGKSSAINAIVQQKSLARTSKAPGRTRELVFFDIGDDRRLVDLPGYGFAKTPAAMRNHWRQAIPAYLSQRHSLKGLILLMDSRHPLTELDQQTLAWTHSLALPVHVLLTKSDKLNKSPAKATLIRIDKEIRQLEWVVSLQLFSAKRREGLNQIYAVLDKWLLS